MAHRTARWLVAGACTIALASGLVAADARLTSLTHTRDAARDALTARASTHDRLRAANDAIGERIDTLREVNAEHEASLASTEGMLP